MDHKIDIPEETELRYNSEADVIISESEFDTDYGRKRLIAGFSAEDMHLKMSDALSKQDLDSELTNMEFDLRISITITNAE